MMPKIEDHKNSAPSRKAAADVLIKQFKEGVTNKRPVPRIQIAADGAASLRSPAAEESNRSSGKAEPHDANEDCVIRLSDAEIDERLRTAITRVESTARLVVPLQVLSSFTVRVKSLNEQDAKLATRFNSIKTQQRMLAEQMNLLERDLYEIQETRKDIATETTDNKAMLSRLTRLSADATAILPDVLRSSTVSLRQTMTAATDAAIAAYASKNERAALNGTRERKRLHSAAFGGSNSDVRAPIHRDIKVQCSSPPSSHRVAADKHVAVETVVQVRDVGKAIGDIVAPGGSRAVTHGRKDPIAIIDSESENEVAICDTEIIEFSVGKTMMLRAIPAEIDAREANEVKEQAHPVRPESNLDSSKQSSLGLQSAAARPLAAVEVLPDMSVRVNIPSTRVASEPVESKARGAQMRTQLMPRKQLGSKTCCKQASVNNGGNSNRLDQSRWPQPDRMIARKGGTARKHVGATARKTMGVLTPRKSLGTVERQRGGDDVASNEPWCHYLLEGYPNSLYCWKIC
jgi:hypothetical protein